MTSGRKAEEFPVSKDEKIIKKDKIRVASVCFITDAGNCSGDKFSSNETPGGGSGNPGQNPEYNTPQEQCVAAGYGVTSCPDGSHGSNSCPADSSYYKECACDANMTETCTKPYYGVGPSCDGKYARCERDDERACKEDGYTQTGSCGALQVSSGNCPYDSSYFRECVCQPGLVSCVSPQLGVGSSCDGKYLSCQCPSSYRSCDCGGEAGASSCNDGSGTKYTSCKSCCNSSSPDWCSVHDTCHGDCCTDGTIDSCDTRCGGSGCSSGNDNTDSGEGSTHIHEYTSCPSGFSFSDCGDDFPLATSFGNCYCGAVVGTCYKCK